MIRIRELLKEIGGLSLHGHRNEGKWYGQEAELKDYEEFEELESLIEKQNELLTLSLQLNNVWRNRFDYNNSESYIVELEEKIKKIKGENKKMKKIYELEYQVNKILDGFYSHYVNNGSPITLREILTFGFNGVYKNGEYPKRWSFYNCNVPVL